MENNKEEKVLNRRNLLKMGAAGALGTSTIAKAICQNITAAQTEGPFYPIEAQDDLDWDLTIVNGRTERAKGTVVIVRGTVTDQNCEPVAGALVEIWQACESGRYNHASDPNTSAPLDPNFQYWAEQVTNENGEYMFKTIIPGQYPASRTWVRPSHIHFKINKRGFRELTTQMYFKDDPFNSRDLILQALSREEQANVVVEFVKSENDLYPVGNFEIKIQSIQ